jgi:hypothetical protein
MRHWHYPPLLTEAQRAAHRADLARVMAEWPELSDFGFGTYDEERLTPEARQRNFERDRADLASDRALDGFVAARAWLARWAKTKRLADCGTSYGLKHHAASLIGYVSNGAFICAALAEGFQIEREGPNALINIDRAAWGRW